MDPAIAIIQAMVTKDMLQPPKHYHKGENIAAHLDEVEQYMRMRFGVDLRQHAHLLLNFLDEQSKLLIRSQPDFTVQGEDYE